MIKAYQGWRFNADASEELHDILAEIFSGDRYIAFDWLIIADNMKEANQAVKEFASFNVTEYKEFGGKIYVMLLPPEALSDEKIEEFLELLK